MSRFALFAVCGLIVALAGCQDAKKTASEAAAKKVYTREEFKKLVVGKTPEEVTAALGRPDSTSESGEDRYWYYNRVTTDPASGKIDNRVQVVIVGDRVIRVTF